MKKWLYFLLDDEGRSYSVVNGIVTKTAQPTPLPFTPDGWQGLSIGWERNLNRFGIVRNFSLPLGFVETANTILRHIVLTGTSEEKVFLLIKKLSLEIDDDKYQFIYRYFYKGELDLTTVELGEDKSTVRIMEGGTSKLLAANEDTVCDIPLNDPEAISVRIDGFAFNNLITYETIEFSSVVTLLDRKVVLPMFEKSFDGARVPEIIKQSTYEQVLSGPDFIAEEVNFFFRNNRPPGFQYRIQGEIKFTVESGSDTEIGFKIQSQNRGTTLTTQTVYDEPLTEYTLGDHTISFDTTITVPLPIVGAESLYIVILHDGVNSVVKFTASQIAVDFVYRFAPTTHKCLKPSTLLKRLAEKQLGGPQFADVSFFEDDKDNLVVTSGDELRLIQNSVLKTSLKDFFQAYNCWYQLGADVYQNRYRVLFRNQYMDANNVPFNLGKAKNLKVSFAADLLSSNIKAGYKEQEYEETWGKNEFNNTFVFNTPITRKKQELVLVSPYRADPTGIEVTRINFDGKKTTDDKIDNEIFVLNVDFTSQNEDGSYNLKRPAFTITGIPEESRDSIYNIDQLTPKRILLSHGSWIRSVLMGFEERRLIFQSTEKNRELRTVQAGEVIDEDLDELIGNLQQPYFKPYLLEFECESPNGLVDVLETNPNRPFQFEWYGDTYTGFLLNIGLSPDDKKEQSVTLISTINNDLTKLI